MHTQTHVSARMPVVIDERIARVNGSGFFIECCLAWLAEECAQRKKHISVHFTLANERFPVAAFFCDGIPVVSLWYYPATMTVSCLSGKACHDTQRKIEKKNNLLSLYMELYCEKERISLLQWYC